MGEEISVIDTVLECDVERMELLEEEKELLQQTEQVGDNPFHLSYLLLMNRQLETDEGLFCV